MEEHSNTQRTPYLFTAKELDEETGLYYFGARYYDPRTSVWQSPDPILGTYLRGAPNGGIYQPVNLSLFSYSRQNPVAFSDANGQFWGAASKLVKLAVKGGDLAATFAGVVEDTNTLFSSDASFGERLLAAGSLATEIVSPVSARDVKAGINAIEAGAKHADDVRDLGKVADNASDAAGASKATPDVLTVGKNGSDETTTLYRAVEPEEYKDIMETGQFRTSPESGGMMCKQFGCDLDETVDFANSSAGKNTSAIMGVEVPKSVVDDLNAGNPNVDQHIFKSGTVTIDDADLGTFNDSIVGKPFDALE